MAIKTNKLKTNKLKGGSTSTSSPDLSKQIENYKTRLTNIGKNPEEATDKRNWLEKKLNLEKDQNVLFDIFEVLDRPRNALFTAVDKAVQGESFLEGLKEGITGETDTSGKDLLVNTFNMEDEEGKLDLSDVLGFGLDIVGDPLDWALIPLTGGASKVAELGADTAKTIKTVDNIADATQTAKKAYSYTKLDDLLGLSEKGVHLATGNELIGKGVGKALKTTGKIADKTIQSGLNVLDTLENKKVTKLAGGVENVDDFLRNLDINPNTIGTRAQGYNNFKKGFIDTFNQGKTTLGKLKEAMRRGKGKNQLLDEALKPYISSLEDLSYRYTIDNSKNIANFADDLADLNKFTSKKGNTVAKWISNNPGNELAKILKSEQNTVAEDILNVIQSDKSNLFRKQDIDEFIRTGKFSGSKESVENLNKLLNDTADRAGLVFKEGPVSNVVDDVLKNSTLDVIDTDTLKKLYKNPQFKEELNNLGLSYNFEYTPEEIARINDLKSNKDFMNLVEQNRNAYKDIADRTKGITGMSYDDIVNRIGYVRKAQGSVADIEGRIAAIDNLLADKNLSDLQRESWENTRNALNEQLISGSGTSVNTMFGSQQYRQPALVANRQYKESIESQIKDIDSQIKSLKGQTSRSKTDKYVSEIKKIDATSAKMDAQIKKLERQNIRVDKVNEGIEKASQAIKKTSDDITDNIVTKSKKIQNQAVTNQFAKQLTNVNNLKKQVSKLTKQLENASDDAVESIVKNLDNVESQLIDASNQLRKTTAIIDGHVDDTIIKSLDSNARNINKYVEQSKKLDSLTATKNELTDRILKTKEQISNLTTGLDDAIKNVNFNLENIDKASDDIIKNRIKELSKSKSILEEEAGQTLFNLNYYAGLEDFVTNVEFTNKTAHVFNDAITMGVFNDPNVVKTAANIGDNPDNWVKVSGTNLSNRLNAIQNMIGETTDKNTIKALKESLRGNNYWMDPRVANLFGVASSPKQNTNALLNIVDKFNTTFKKYSTLTPGFQLRNYVGNSFNMYLSGMPVGQIVPYQAKATKVLNKADDLIKKVSQGGEAVLDEIDLADWNLLKQFYEGGFSGAGKAARDLESLQKSIQLGSKYNPINKLSDINIKLNESADAMNRMALLMYANDDLAKGGKYLSKLNAENPIQAVKYALMDPSNMSEVEQNVIKRLVPFYTFTKQNLMFQATNLLKNTAKYRNFMKALEDSYNDLPEDSYYDYQKSAMQIPMPSNILGLPIPGMSDDEGDQLFLKANLPLSDLGEFLSNPVQRIMSSTTPLIKAPVEAITGKSLYTGDDTTYNNLSKALQSMGINDTGVQDSAQAVELILNNFGLQNVSTNIVKKLQAIFDNANGEKSGQQLWAEIFRSLVQNTNAENVINSGLYDDLEAYQALVKELKNQGTDVPTIREITSSNKLKLNNLKKKRAS